MLDMVKTAWAWLVSFMATGAGFIVESGLLTIAGVLLTAMTIAERYRAFRKHRAQEKLAEAETAQITDR